ncbi:hypothetical protein WN943_012453 [Citrus x changshan-huyou]
MGKGFTYKSPRFEFCQSLGKSAGEKEMKKIAVATSMQQASSAREPYRAIQFHATDVALLITIAMEEAPLTLTAVVAPPLPTARGPQPSQLIDS